MRKGIIFITVILFILFFHSCKPATGPASLYLPEYWKFNPGDNPEWALNEFDDSGWDSISVKQVWNKSGFTDLDKFAWYRIKVFIPSSLRKNMHSRDGLIFDLGRVDDMEQTFLNGYLIGQNGTSIDTSEVAPEFKMFRGVWLLHRKYNLSADDPRIHWDKENVIAVRVWNRGGPGGIYDANPSLRIPGIADFVKIDSKATVYHIKNATIFDKELQIRNISKNFSFTGQLHTTVKDQITGTIVFEDQSTVTLIKDSIITQSVHFVTAPGQNCIANYRFKDTETGEVITMQDPVPYILTPEPPGKPRINGTSVYGARPGRPFLYKIPATGEKPLQYEVAGLPEGLKVNPEKGLITGTVKKAGNYKTTLKATNKVGSNEKEFLIRIGNQIVLTPPMGWNSWNCWGLSVSDGKIRISANQFVKSGLADHGWSYINIDDGWEKSTRLPDGSITGNEKFPDFPALSEYVHSLGLKLGIYSGPGPLTCGGYPASYRHEFQDAQTWADWGIDYLKYDWCSYGKIAKDRSLPELQKPYILMRKALDKVNRDIVYSLCQYGMGNVWEWGAKVGGNLWRTTGDITDTWKSLSSIGFRQDAMSPFAGPGHWNDPDMLIVGWVGWGPRLHPSRLTPDEQYTHISLWSLLSAPLLLGNDLAQLDDFTLNLLTNDEVLAINQDPLGKQAGKVYDKEGFQFWKKELSNGSFAVGVFNLSDTTKSIHLNFSDLVPEGRLKVRDLWRQKDLATSSQGYDATVPPHGVFLIKINRAE